MDRNLYHPYTNANGKKVSGSAALNHYIFTEKGGLQNYHDEIGTTYINEFVKAHTDIINASIARKAKKSQFKVVS